ncbi:aminotransferase class I and II [Parvibaculum lavamentivorans DS-1]|uniref:Aminotransferase class I and II n=1 Tax=Parvibaculum lavamentivorans (strain DS-1 / DSM 13023 / NCIMB 13966) TaxID=402881 RepID=A7HSN8_PARL1|nr:aminotransferase class I/II-fold pyridoxal phosphate-dependent enzyme [Parvibaculum lavamentivorans]ABS62921.1 aminotransferase class I and II [Parvibaculum lavamentivorans DS-1]
MTASAALSRFDGLPGSPFPRLNALIEGIEPGRPPLVMSLGEPQHAFPSFVTEEISRNAALFGKYPPIIGTAAFRDAAAGWLGRRYGLEAAIGKGRALDPNEQVLPVNGTREALFSIAQIATPPEKAGRQPAILMPNPFYQCYAAAALAAGAEPVYVDATRETGFMPDFAALPEELLARTAMIYFCSPANPQGSVASLDYLKRLILLARRYAITLAIDECYADIYDREPPAGALQAAMALAEETGGGGDPFANIIVFHSLSKRSSLPGLRSGFCAGERALMQRFRNFRNIACPQVPLPLMAASAACWNDDAHASANRDLYRAKIDAAERVFGNRFGFYRPAGGFFLWLDVGDGEKAARELWAKAGVKVLPGAYLSREDSPYGPGGNPGAAYIRVALVDGQAETEEALARMAEVL